MSRQQNLRLVPCNISRNPVFKPFEGVFFAQLPRRIGSDGNKIGGNPQFFPGCVLFLGTDSRKNANQSCNAALGNAPKSLFFPCLSKKRHKTLRLEILPFPCPYIATDCGTICPSSPLFERAVHRFQVAMIKPQSHLQLGIKGNHFHVFEARPSRISFFVQRDGKCSQMLTNNSFGCDQSGSYIYKDHIGSFHYAQPGAHSLE